MSIKTIICVAFCALLGMSVGFGRKGVGMHTRHSHNDSPLKWGDYSDLATLIERLPAWGDRDFDAAEWQDYLATAAVFQNLTDEDVERTLLVYLDRAWNKHGRAMSSEALSQPVILLRVMFQVSTEPFSAVEGDTRGSLQARGVSMMGAGLWYRPFDPDADRTIISVSHPIAFDATGPHLVGAIVTGVPGSVPSRPAYQAHLEHRAFVEMYADRDLEPFLTAERPTWRELVARLSEPASRN